MLAGDVRVFCGDTNMAPPAGIIAGNQLSRLCHGNATIADIQIHRRIDLRIVEFHQHIIASNAQMRRTKGDKGRHIETAHPDNRQVGHIGIKFQQPGRRIIKGRFRHNANTVQHRAQLVQYPPFRQGQHQRFIRGHNENSGSTVKQGRYMAHRPPGFQCLSVLSLLPGAIRPPICGPNTLGIDISKS